MIPSIIPKQLLDVTSGCSSLNASIKHKLAIIIIIIIDFSVVFLCFSAQFTVQHVMLLLLSHRVSGIKIKFGFIVGNTMNFSRSGSLPRITKDSRVYAESSRITHTIYST